MDKNIFKEHLIEATKFILPFMRGLVVNPLPDECVYILWLAENYYHYLANSNPNVLGSPFTVPIEIISKEKQQKGLVRALSVDQVAGVLADDGAVPKWIDLTIHSTNSICTYIMLECSNELITEEAELYHQEEGYPPFHVEVDLCQLVGEVLNWMESLTLKTRRDDICLC